MNSFALVYPNPDYDPKKHDILIDSNSLYDILTKYKDIKCLGVVIGNELVINEPVRNIARVCDSDYNG